MVKWIMAIGILLFGLALASLAQAAEINFGATGHNGTVNSFNYHADVNVSDEDSYASAEWNYGKTADIVSSDNAYLKLGYDPALSAKWSLWFFNQTGYNKVRGIEIEDFLGVGPKYTFIKSKKVSLSMSTGLIFHYISDTMGVRSVKRMSWRPKASYQGEMASVSFVAFYQPDIDDFNDYIVTGKIITSYKISEVTSIKIVLNDEYRSVTEGKKNELTKMLMLGIEL